ncbi:acyl-CoA carboxylase epsilon subunit [Thermostaphylospora chromogena]|uniref:acyl-CoA carboxylase epsilon subunit n=1 Tax=Thermostaphylospora chromogena TaxID=35622 RepID=UPI002418B7D8|nr:hypothetical protein [Thermostaphylospora chromogena]
MIVVRGSPDDVELAALVAALTALLTPARSGGAGRAAGSPATHRPVWSAAVVRPAYRPPGAWDARGDAGRRRLPVGRAPARQHAPHNPSTRT